MAWLAVGGFNAAITSSDVPKIDSETTEVQIFTDEAEQ